MTERNYERLCDRVLIALEMALQQKDMAIADLLGRALEMALTRGAGGKNFVERRDLDDDVQKALVNLDAFRKASKGL